MDKLLIHFVKTLFTLHQQFETMETQNNDHRTNLQVHEQAKTLFKNVYTQITGNPTSEKFLPFAMDYKVYQQIKIECLSIAKRYEDLRLEKEIQNNLTYANCVR